MHICHGRASAIVLYAWGSFVLDGSCIAMTMIYIKNGADDGTGLLVGSQVLDL